MNKVFLISLFTFQLSLFAKAQESGTDTVDLLKEVVVTGFKPGNPHYTSLNIEPYSLVQMNEKAPLNLSDALAKLPGISQLTTGNAISKPVIRGMFGNRVLALLSGLRFDNQQWQDEHGLGLSQIGISRVEVIKGPASLLYGTDAVGGVINIVEEKPTKQGIRFDAGTQFYSNSLGSLTDAGLGKRNGNQWWRLRGGYENHADYSDGNGNRVLNSRNRGYYVKAGFGFEKRKWQMDNSYNFSYNQYGFIIEGLDEFFAPDKRWSRSLAGPHHNVMLNLLNSQNTFFLKKSLLKINAGVQSNLRAEDEGGGQISLKMHLLSGLENLRWEKNLNSTTTFIANQQFTYTNNTNYGGRIIVPDANLIENNASGYFKFNLKKIIFETGLGVNQKYIQTKETGTLNTPGAEIQPFTRNKFTGNVMAGFAYNPKEGLTLKTNISTGTRAPNLAELSSNGLHEGVYRYEIGDPTMKNEQNLNTDIMFELDKESFFFSGSAYYNHFFGYIWLSPTSEKFFGYPVYRYKQQDANLYGSEIVAILKPASLKHWQWKEVFAFTNGKLKDSGYLPFIAPAKLSSSIRFETTTKKGINIFAEPEVVYNAVQNNPAQFETATPSYTLINFSSGVELPAANGNWRIGFNINNLTGKQYFDHLSRLKYLGLYNEGINFIVSARKEIKW